MGSDIRKISLGNLETKAVRIADLVDYQEDAVVSRTIVDKKTGAVTLFVFDEGQKKENRTRKLAATIAQP